MVDKTSSRKITAAERRVKATHLRKAGATYQEIGDALGVTPQAAYKMVSRAISINDKKTSENVEEMRELELQRLDKLFFLMYQKAMAGTMGAVDRCIKIMERRAKLQGLDAPAAIDMTTKGKGLDEAIIRGLQKAYGSDSPED